MIVRVLPYLSAKGHTIKTLASDLGSDKPHFNEYTFKGLHSFSYVAGVPQSESPIVLQYLTYPIKLLFFLFNPWSYRALKKVLDDYQPDVVHLHTMVQVTPSVLFLLKDKPTVMTLWGPETFICKLLIWCLTPRCFKAGASDDPAALSAMGAVTYCFFKYAQKWVYRLGLRNVDIYTAPSKYLQRTAAGDVSRIVHVPSYTELQMNHQIAHKGNLLYVGRLVNVKGVEYLITAMPAIMKGFPEARLTIVGDGFGKAALVNLTKRLRIEDHVRFVGYVDHDSLDAYYQWSSVVVIPSIWPENYSITCMEAMSAGRPVICSNVGGFPELVDDGVSGFLIEPGRSEQIAETAVRLLSDDQLLRDMGANARRKAESMIDIRSYADALERVYAEALRHYEPLS